MSQVNEQDVKAIREWLAKEPYLPNDLDDVMLKKFIFSCFFSLEKTKKCIDKFCTYRATLSEVYTKRDPTAAKMQHAYSTIDVAQYPAGPHEIVIHQLREFTDEFDFYAAIMSFTVIADHWLLKEMDHLYEGQIIILDIGKYSMLLLTKVNIFYFQKFVVSLLESMPICLKAIHLVNCPPITDYLYNLVKAALPEEVRKMIKFHITSDGLHEYIDKQYLPQDYGGDATVIHKQSKIWLNELLQRREFFRNDNLWKAELTKKANADKEHTMNGSFRTLAID